MRRRLAIVLGAGLSLVLAAGPATAVTAPPTPTPRAADVDTSAVSGTVEILAGDDFESGTSTQVAHVVTDEGRVEIPSRLAQDLVAGSTVEVTTDAGGDVTGVAPLTAPAPTAAAPDKGTHELVFMPATVGTTAPPLTTAQQAQDLTTKVDAYYNTVTKGAIRFTRGSVVPFTVASATSANSCSAEALYTAAVAKLGTAAKSRFHHIVIVTPDIAGCSFAGLGSMAPYQDGRQRIWLFGTEAVRSGVLAHELGHNFGLEHSDQLLPSCANPTTPTQALSSSCFEEYGDPWDVMGGMYYSSSRDVVGHMSASHLDKLGLLPAAEKVTPRSTATVRLTPVAKGTAPQGSYRLLSIPYGSRVYTVEYRQATAGTLDSWINTAYNPSRGAAGSGVVIRLADVNGANQETSFMPPGAATRAWQAGQTFTAGALSIKVVSADANGASIAVTRDIDTGKPSFGTVGYPYDYMTVSGRGDVLERSDLKVVWTSVKDTGSAVATVALVVDGKQRVVTPRPAPYTPLKYSLSNGKHTWQLVARDVFGNAVSTTKRVVFVDTAKPKVTAKPAAYLTNGTVSTKTVPVKVKWGMSDACGFFWTGVQGSNGLDKAYTKAVTAVTSRLTFKQTSQFAFQAQDCALTLTPVTLGPKTTASLVSTPSSTAYKGSWATVTGSKYLGKSAKASKKAGASVTYKVKARAIGVVVTKGKGYGKAYVYVDGKKAATVDLSASSTAYGKLVYSKNWSTAGTHTIKVVATSSKKVVVDGFVRLS
ncbi:reprolysin-like metallopeptidase [Cellulomonas massiliensis]|uniref:reprolysin-like metallopeptidase n=1 Tax=Cellulomonas massiliensis TaxID=1465811 RepID=UPI0002DB6555|nr:hypothetical protein [Cellulomonas massiliensis]